MKFIIVEYFNSWVSSPKLSKTWYTFIVIFFNPNIIEERKKPVIIYNLTTSKISSKNINIRLDFDLESNSSLKIIDYSIDKSENNFVNIVYNFNLEKDAILKNYKLDKEENNNIKYSYNNINLDTNSVAENFILSLGSSFIKNEINCKY